LYGLKVFTLNNLKRAELASFDITEALLSDGENKGSLTVVGNYRSNKISDTHPLAQTFLQDLEALKDSTRLSISKISIDNLDVLHVNVMLSNLLTRTANSKLLILLCVCTRRHLATYSL
jgi:hypothetical protein